MLLLGRFCRVKDVGLILPGVWTAEGKGGVRMWIDRAARVEIGRALWWNLGMYNTHRVDMGRLGEKGHRAGAGACTTQHGGCGEDTGGGLGKGQRSVKAGVRWSGLDCL